MTTTESTPELRHPTLAAALAAFQAELPSIEKGNTVRVPTKSGPAYSYDYADLSDVSARVLPLLGRHGLAWVTRPYLQDNLLVLEYRLLHESGEDITGLYPLGAAATPAQQMGAAITYARRYTLCAVTGVAPGGDDHDGPPAPQPAQAQPGPPADYLDLLAGVTSRETGQALWQRAGAEGWLNADVQAAITARVSVIATGGDA